MFPQTVDYVLSHRVNFNKIIQYGMIAMLYKVLNFVFKKINLKTIPFFTDLTKTMQCPNLDFKFIPLLKARPPPLFFSNFGPDSQSPARRHLMNPVPPLRLRFHQRGLYGVNVQTIIAKSERLRGS